MKEYEEALMGLGLSNLLSEQPMLSFAKAIAQSLSMTREYFGAEAVIENWQKQIARIKITSKPSRNKKVVQGRKWNVLRKADSCVNWSSHG